jgi:uncharacterized membrane protein (DUF106 family)
MAPPLSQQQQRQSAIEAIAENGRVLATLDDWRAIAFVLVIVLLVLVGIIIALLRATRLERKEMSDERSRMWAVADKFGAAADKLTAQLQVHASLSARVEGALARCEEIHREHRSG